MAIKIKCPYCFGIFDDDRVHFRSEYVQIGNNKQLLKGFDNLTAFEMGYEGEDKESIIMQYKESSFYAPGEDEKYDRFWSRFNGKSTEKDPNNRTNDENMSIYRRKVIDPTDELHKRHLCSQQGGGYLIRDAEKRNMVTSVKLADGNGSVCSKRVCPFCHNPLPSDYGLYEVKFISVIGIVGAGKTVFLSQFLNDFEKYAAKCDLTALKRTAAIHQFLEENEISVGVTLPQPTQRGFFEQPLIYNIERNKNGKRETITIVMYDIAGEVFKADNMDEVSNYAPFIRESDGIMLLVDPEQFESIAENRNKKVEQSPADALNNIRTQIMGSDEKCKKPVAVCVSKMDSIVSFLASDLINYIQSDYAGELVEGNAWKNQQIFNMQSHQENGRKLEAFIAKHDTPIMQTLDTGFDNYQFFGFTALGCDVDESGKPIGPIQPHRIEEPILWMFSEVGLVGTNAMQCPRCKRNNVIRFDTKLREIQRRESRLFRSDRIYTESVPVNCRCNYSDCNYEWFIDKK